MPGAAPKSVALHLQDFSGFSKSPSGLEYKVVAEGYGVKPKAGQGIKAHYSGYLLNGAKFDSSYDRRSPLGFAVRTLLLILPRVCLSRPALSRRSFRWAPAE